MGRVTDRFAKSWLTSAVMRSAGEQLMRSSTVNISQISSREMARFWNHYLTYGGAESLAQNRFSIGNLYAKDAY
jgi:hypothetical protein